MTAPADTIAEGFEVRPRGLWNWDDGALHPLAHSPNDIIMLIFWHRHKNNAKNTEICTIQCNANNADGTPPFHSNQFLAVDKSAE